MAPSLRSVRNLKQTIPSRTRSTRNQISYREQTSDSDREEFNDNVSDDDTEAAPLRSRGHRALPPAATTASPPSKTSKKRKASGPGHRRQNGSIKSLKLDEADADLMKDGGTAIQFTGKTMPWPTLPYHILLAIFDYASRPLINETLQPTPSINWLCNVALCCKAFAEPAISALYYSPPLYPRSRAHHLLSHLVAHKDISTYNYGAKIKYLDMDGYGTMQRTYVGSEPLDLGALVSLTPQLRGIALNLDSDDVTGSIHRKIAGRAVYNHSMATALQENKIMLQDWTWDHLLAKQSQSAFPLAQMKDVHALPSFQNLRSLTFANYPAGPVGKGRPCEDVLAEAINLLPKLINLHFHGSSVNDRLLSKLSHNLQTLKIEECSVLKSSSLDSFLAKKGTDMRQLILNHNRSLNFSFMTNLAESCPRLELLKADLRYFRTLNVIRDTDPKYDALLHDGERPTWPVTLRSLELFQLRKWSLETAELFFSSLTNSAETLPDLRQLRIKASLNESGWRERIAFRDNWTEKLRRVFLRRSPPPNPHLRSIAAFKAFKAQQKKSKMAIREEKRQIRTRAAASSLNDGKNVQANGIGETPQSPKEDSAESNSDAPLLHVRRSIRAKPNPSTQPESPPTPARAPRRRRRRHHQGSDSSSSEDSAIDDDGVLELDAQRTSVDREAELYIQGLCDVVDVLIDNLRPMEEELKEDDFLDEEVSGDEDWNGDDDVPGEGGYAW